MDTNAAVLTIVVVVIASCVIYDRFYLESIKDVHELSLTEQASVSTTRKNGESAIYRSLDVMHGMPLTVGLQVRYDIYKMRNGSLKDVWKIAMSPASLGKKISLVHKNGVDTTTLTHAQLDSQISVFAAHITKSVATGRKVALHAPLGQLESIVVLLGTFFYTRCILANFTRVPKLRDPDVDLVCCHSDAVDAFAKLGYDKFVVLDNAGGALPAGAVAIADILKDASANDGKSYDYHYSKDDDTTKAFVDTINYQEVEFSQVQFVSSIASQLRSLPMEHAWTDHDKLMVEISPEISSSSSAFLLNENALVKVLSGLVAGVDEIVIVPSDHLSLATVKELSPTILSVSESSLAGKIVGDASNVVGGLGFFQNALLRLSSSWFSRGIHNSFFKHPRLPKLRILYSEILAQAVLSSSQINYLHALFSSRIVSERFKVSFLGPILKTNFFDYRVLDEDVENSVLKVRKLGIAANCLELKVQDHGLRQAENNEGELVARGFNIGKMVGQGLALSEEGDDETDDKEGWMPLGIFGKFGDDGCFYEYF